MGDIEVLNRIDNTHLAKITKPDGTELSPLERIACVIYLEADYQRTRAEFPDPDKFTRKMQASMWGLLVTIAADRGIAQ